MIQVTQTYQCNFADYLDAQKAIVIDAWAEWRNAQALDDESKSLVDEVYNEYIRTLDKLKETMLPF